MDPIMAKEISIAVPEKKAFLMIAPEKAVSHMAGRKSEALDKNVLLIESRAQDPADSVTVTSPFSATGKVPGRSAKAAKIKSLIFMDFFKNCTDISANRRK